MITPGQTVYITPIRFWETRELVTGTVKEVCADNFMYLFHNEYGHDVYVSKDKIFATPEEAQIRIDQMIEQREKEIEAETEIILQRILERKRADEQAKSC